MWLALMISMTCAFVSFDRAESQPVRGAFPSPSVQILPMMVAQEKGFYKREGLDLELVFVRGASTAVQALPIRSISFSRWGRKCPRCGKEAILFSWLNRWGVQPFR